MRVLVISDSRGVSEFYRAVTPFRILEEAGDIELTMDSGLNPALADHVNEYDCIVFIRSDAGPHHSLMLHAKMNGVRTVFDVDDNLLLLPPSIHAYAAWHERGTGRITSRLWYFKRNLQMADMLTVSTDALGRQLCNGEPHDLRQPGDYLVLPNQILAESWNVPPAEKPEGEVWVGWWGIYNHWDDWRDVAGYIEPVIIKRPEVRLMILGMPEIAHLFPTLCETGQLVTFPFVSPDDLDDYRSIVKSFDVALAPTSFSAFNVSKSDLKLLQYGAAGVPVIASKVTYASWQDYALLPERPDEWGGTLEYALDNLSAFKDRAELLQGKVMSERTYEANYEKWLEVISD